MKWAVAVVATLAVLFTAYVMHGKYVRNPRVVEEIRQQPDSKRAGIVMLLTFDGRTIPVNYLRENGKVFVGADGLWWRAFRDGADVTMWIRGESLSGHAVTVLDDPAYTKDVFSRLRPTVPKWLPDWLNGKLIEITPTDTST